MIKSYNIKSTDKKKLYSGCVGVGYERLLYGIFFTKRNKWIMEKIIINCFKKFLKIRIYQKKIDNLKMSNYDSWDSLTHIKLLLEIEKKMKIKFSMKEISEINSFNKIVSKIKKIKKIDKN